MVRVWILSIFGVLRIIMIWILFIFEVLRIIIILIERLTKKNERIKIKINLIINYSGKLEIELFGWDT